MGQKSRNTVLPEHPIPCPSVNVRGRRGRTPPTTPHHAPFFAEPGKELAPERGCALGVRPASGRAARGEVIIWMTAKKTAGIAVSLGNPDAATKAAAMLRTGCDLR